MESAAQPDDYLWTASYAAADSLRSTWPASAVGDRPASLVRDPDPICCVRRTCSAEHILCAVRPGSRVEGLLANGPLQHRTQIGRSVFAFRGSWNPSYFIRKREPEFNSSWSRSVLRPLRAGNRKLVLAKRVIQPFRNYNERTLAGRRQLRSEERRV